MVFVKAMTREERDARAFQMLRLLANALSEWEGWVFKDTVDPVTRKRVLTLEVWEATGSPDGGEINAQT